MSQLDQIKKCGTVIVADTGVIEDIKELHPADATTNPSLLQKAITSTKYNHFIDEAIGLANAWAKRCSYENDSERILAATMDYLFAIFGREIMKVIDGYVSTEIDARLSYNTQATVARGLRFIEIYKELECDPARVLLKIASTWEGLQAAKILEAQGIKCNCTLLFCQAQAAVAADAKAFLISPFVGRITDWFMKNEGRKAGDWFDVEVDPGVVSVRNIYRYYKQHNIKTIVMGASFRHKNQCVALAGCDRLTISPQLLRELMACNDNVPCVLSDKSATSAAYSPVEHYTQTGADPMANEKLTEGIKTFAEDAVKVENLLKAYKK